MQLKDVSLSSSSGFPSSLGDTENLQQHNLKFKAELNEASTPIISSIPIFKTLYNLKPFNMLFFIYNFHSLAILGMNILCLNLLYLFFSCLKLLSSPLLPLILTTSLLLPTHIYIHIYIHAPMRACTYTHVHIHTCMKAHLQPTDST